MMYMTTNNDRFPKERAVWPFPTPPAPGELDAQAPSVAGLMKLLHRYVKNPGIWTCPVGARRELNAATCSEPPGGGRYLVGWVRLDNGEMASTNYISYPLNRADGDPVENARGMTAFEAMSAYGNHFSEGGPGWQMGYRQPGWNNRNIQCGYIPGNNQWRPHFNATTILFYDGHVASVMDYRTGK